MANTPMFKLMFVMLFILDTIPNPSFSCPLHQKQALLHFKSTLTTIIDSKFGLNIKLKSWNPYSDCCSWDYVNCSTTRTVTELNLYNLVPPSDINPVPVYSSILAPLFHIHSLELLDISWNSLLGEIPGDGLGNLTKLIHLDMAGNRFNCSIPTQFFQLTNLRYLDLGNKPFPKLRLEPGSSQNLIALNSLSGNIPEEIGNLTNLIHLDMLGNRFNGSIPTQFFQLTNLCYLDLGNNLLVGKLSSEIGKLQNLESLMLYSNYFLGNIPEEIWNLTKLRVLHVANNQFYDRIPSSIVNLKELEELYLAENSLYMQIPAEIGRLLNMTILDLSDNQLTGPIPPGIQNLSKLHGLALHDNMFVGDIPTWLFKIRTLKLLYICGEGDNLIWDNNAKIVPRVSLVVLSMTSCGISGKIPEWISSQKDLNVLDLSMNQLEGRLPYWLARNHNIQVLFLSNNNLSGTIPPSLFESTMPLTLDLSRNNFFGELPESIGSAQGPLVSILLSENSFSGHLPMSISKIANLHFLKLDRNKFSGDNLPAFRCTSKCWIDLSYNNFFGKIPESFSIETETLFLGGNKFSGNLPRNFSKLVNLKHLDLHNNDITGNLQDFLPQIQTLEVLILRNNSFEGFIPRTISNLASLRILDISGNNLTGSIPNEIANLTRMIEKPHILTSTPKAIHTSLSPFPFKNLVVIWKRSFQGLAILNLEVYTMLDLSDNRISGEIPPSLGNLKGLKLLNISHNRISGHIPVSFGDLEDIESLDLSHNEIMGVIPQSLAKLHQLGTLDLSYNRLTGKIPVGGQMDTMTSFQNNSGLCGLQIRVRCTEDIPPSPSETTVDEEDEKESWFCWEATWVGFLIGLFSSILIIGHLLNFLQLFKIW